MPLTKDIATRIVDPVQHDAECQRRINSVLRILPGDLGWGGPVRNTVFVDAFLVRQAWGRLFSNALRDEDLSDPQYADFACSGIADAALRAIERAKIPDLKGVSRLDRLIPGEEDHSGVLVELPDGSEYVFDWWRTLDVGNPMIYHKMHWFLKEHLEAMRYTYRHFDPSLYDLTGTSKR